jgi:PAS domain S-box-containing protein
MREPNWQSVEASDRRGRRAKRSGRRGPPHHDAGWALQALSVARIVFYSSDYAACFMMRSDNCTDLLGLPSAGSTAAWPEAIRAEDRAQYVLALEGLSPQSPCFEAEYRLQNAVTGQHVWVLDRGAAEFDAAGRLASLRGAIIDVSPGIGIEAELRKASRLRSVVFQSAHVAAWHFDLRRRELHWSPEMFALYGLDPADGQPPREVLARRIPPGHRRRARKAFAQAMLKGGSFTLEFPIIRTDGAEIWTALAGDVIKDEQGRPICAQGIGQDITERKNWETRQAMLLRELSHRVKNTLAVVQSLARQTLRSSPSTESFVEAFEGRIRSLAASHTLLTEADWSGAMLETVIRHQVAALVDDYHERIRLKGPGVLLSAELATQLGLVLHELATNAAKYGALSVCEGQVDIVWTVTKTRLRMVWREHGGPRIEAEPEISGFGSTLISSSATKAVRRFRPEGLVCKLEFAR